MYFIQPAFTNVALNTRSTLQIPAYKAALGKIIVDMTGGAIQTSELSEVSLKIGSRYVIGPIPGSVLQSVNMYNGGSNSNTMLEVNLFDRGANQDFWKEIGALDLESLGENVFLEVVNTETVGTPVLKALVGLCAPQVPDKADPNSTVMEKIKYETLPSTGSTKVTWTPKYNGAKIKRVHFRTPTNNNILSVEVKRNSTLIHDNITAVQNSYILQTLGKVPQNNFYHLDFVADGIHANFLDTAGTAALEFNVYLNAVEQVNAVVELYDVPFNN